MERYNYLTFAVYLIAAVLFLAAFGFAYLQAFVAGG